MECLSYEMFKSVLQPCSSMPADQQLNNCLDANYDHWITEVTLHQKLQSTLQKPVTWTVQNFHKSLVKVHVTGICSVL